MRQLPPLNALHAFEVAARYLNFQKAAEELDVTPTAISHQIKVLEEHLGVTLFRRRPRPLALTAAGEALYPLVRESFDAIAGAIAQLQHPDTMNLPVVLTASVTNVFAAKWLVPRLPEFQRTHADINLRLQTSNDVVDLHDRTVDLAIRYGKGNYPGFIVRPLMSDMFAPVCSPQLLTGDRTLTEPRDLAHHSLLHFEWIHYGAEAPNWKHWLATAGVEDIDPARGITFNEESLAIQAAIARQGVALCSSIHVADDVASGLLVQPFDLALEGFQYATVYLENHPKEPFILTFVDWLAAVSLKA